MFANVYYISRLMANIISVSQLDEMRYDICIKEGVMSRCEPSGQLRARVEHVRNWLYLLTVSVAQLVCLAEHGKESVWHWHARLGHINMSVLQRMAHEDMVQGLPPINQVDQLDDACLTGKQKRSSFLSQA